MIRVQPTGQVLWSFRIAQSLDPTLSQSLQVKVVESKCLNNEVTLEELDKNLRQTTKMASDNEQKLDELSR